MYLKITAVSVTGLIQIIQDIIKEKSIVVLDLVYFSLLT